MSDKIPVFPILSILLASMFFITSQSLIVYADYNPNSEILSFDIDINTDPLINYGVPLGTFHGITSEPNTDKIYITVRDPDGERAMNILRVSDSNGYFEYKFDIGDPSVLSEEGTYTATAHIYNEAGETFGESEQAGTFVVTFDNFFQEDEPETEEPLIEEITTDTISYPILANLTLSTDKGVYNSGDTILFSGTVDDPTQGLAITITVADPNSNIVAILQSEPSADNTYQTELIANGIEWEQSGTYYVSAKRSDNGVFNEYGFDFISSEYGNTESNNPQTEFQQEETNPEYSEDLFLGRPVESGSTHFEGFAIGYRSYGVQITDVDSDEQNAKLIVDVYTTASPAFLEITLPRELIDSISGGIDNDFVVMYQGSLADFDEIKTSSTHRTLHISGMHTRLPDYISENQVIEIIGTNLFGTGIDEPEIEDKIKICHMPPGNPSNAHTISIPNSALVSHLEHGDVFGECPEESITEIFGDHTYSDVSISAGSSVPGCEDTKECFVPYQVKIKRGDTVTWSNDDTAAHTVTGGIPEQGRYGFTFDSSLFLAGSIFSVKFDDYEPGTYPYFCMVHPWMTGEVIVVENSSESFSNINFEPKEQPKPKPVDTMSKDQTKSQPVETMIKQKPQSNSIWADKSTYNDGSIIRIDGKVKDTQQNSFVTIKVYSPSNFNIADELLAVSNNGKFAIDFDTSHKLWFENGDYTIKVEDQKNNLIDQIMVTVNEPQGEFLASAEEAPVIPAEKSTKDNDKLADLIEENKKLREELERQGVEIDSLNKQVDYLNEIINSIKGFFGSIFS